MAKKAPVYTILGIDGKPVLSRVKGELGGNARGKIYGTLDCPKALGALAKKNSPYKRFRVFFANRKAAKAAGYRPCGICLRDEYQAWKATRRS